MEDLLDRTEVRVLPQRRQTQCPQDVAGRKARLYHFGGTDTACRILPAKGSIRENTLQRKLLQGVLLRSGLSGLATTRTPLTLLTECQAEQVKEFERLVA